MNGLDITVHNKRIELLAAFVNGVGIATFAVGGLAPILSSIYGGSSPLWLVLAVSTVCFAAACALHYTASAVLKRLKL